MKDANTNICYLIVIKLLAVNNECMLNVLPYTIIASRVFTLKLTVSRIHLVDNPVIQQMQPDILKIIQREV